MLLDSDVPEQYRVWRQEDGSPWRLGSGTAYKATDVRTDDLVVLRFFDAPVNNHREAAALARLGQRLCQPPSARIASLRDLFIRQRTHLAVTEFVDGISLGERVRTHGVWPGEKVQVLAKDALEILATLHGAGVAHGSLRPSKLLLDASGNVLKIVDAGLSPGAATITPAAVDGVITDDLRRLGITLWFTLTGKMPFPEGLAAPDGAVPEWKQLDALPTSPSLRALLALFARTLHSGGNAAHPRSAAALLATLETPGFKPREDPQSLTRESKPPSRSVSLDITAATETNLSPPLPMAARKHGDSKRAAAVALLVFAAGLLAAWFVQTPAGEHRAPSKPKATVAASPALETTNAVNDAERPSHPDVPLLSGGPPVSAVGIEARATRIQHAQPDTLEALKLAREFRRAATLPVSSGQRFPKLARVERVKATLAKLNPETPQAHRTALILIMGYSDEPANQAGAAASQDEADALAEALFHEGITAPLYACGMGGSAGIPEVDLGSAGNEGFVEVWVAFLLF